MSLRRSHLLQISYDADEDLADQRIIITSKLSGLLLSNRPRNLVNTLPVLQEDKDEMIINSIMTDDTLMSYQGLGYVSTYNLNYIAEMDLSSKTILDTYEIPKAQGAYDMTYSPVNHHIFARARVCCSCDDLGGTCSRTSQVLVQTGPSASLNLQDGTCGAGCEGSLADTIGVVEFDTVSKQIVAEHNIKSGTGLGADPVASPDGKYVLLLPNDGGKYVRILSPGKNGEKSVSLASTSFPFFLHDYS